MIIINTILIVSLSSYNLLDTSLTRVTLLAQRLKTPTQT